MSTLYYVLDADTDEVLGEIETVRDSDILEALENSDYIDDVDTCALRVRPDGEFSVIEDGDTILHLSLTDPESEEDDGDEDDEDEDDHDDGLP